jgi:hypothetical protein
MKLAVFYHARISGGSANINPEFGKLLLKHQLDALVNSGLYQAADEIMIGLNGSEEDYHYVSKHCPEDICVLWHGKDSESLLPTMRFIQEVVPDIKDHHCLFFHTKGVTHPHSAIDRAWRECMENVCITHWHKCVSDLDKGYDTVGCHWLTPERFPGMVKSPFWGGVFWWATSKFLSRLPKLTEKNPTCREEWFIPEHWIGTGPRPSVRDYHPFWPSERGCSQAKHLCI